MQTFMDCATNTFPSISILCHLDISKRNVPLALTSPKLLGIRRPHVQGLLGYEVNSVPAWKLYETISK